MVWNFVTRFQSAAPPTSAPTPTSTPGGACTAGYRTVNDFFAGTRWVTGGRMTVNYSGNAYLSLYGWTTSPLVECYPQIYSCCSGADQPWTHTSMDRPALTVNGTTSPGTEVETWSCTGGARQQWILNSNGTIAGVQPGLCLDVTGAATVNGALVYLWTRTGQNHQRWTPG